MVLRIFAKLRVSEQQTEHRFAFIEECKQKSLGVPPATPSGSASRWISSWRSTGKLSDENVVLGTDIDTLAHALDHHTKDNRDKRKALQERRRDLEKSMETIAKSTTEGQKAMQNLYASVESALALATHAEEWRWKEAGADPSRLRRRRLTREFAGITLYG